jgi:hypothetical protein
VVVVKTYRPWRHPQTGRRPPLAGDAVGTRCTCRECREAGVTQRDLIRVPPDAYCARWRWLHGADLREWYDARERALQDARADLRRRHGGDREPGEEG